MKSLMHIVRHMFRKFIRIFSIGFYLIFHLFFSFHREKILFQQKSKYNSLIIVSQCGSKRLMRFNSLSNGSQAQIDLKHKDYPCVNYIQLMILSSIHYPFNLNEKHILIIGLGGGTLPRALRKLYPQAFLTIIEIDPLVYEIAQKYFDFQQDLNMKIFLTDGRKFLTNLSKTMFYDLIFFDAYDFNSGLPSHMKTQEFFNQLKNSIHPNGGLVIFNLVCIYESYLNVRQTIISIFGQQNFLTYRSNDFVNMIGIASVSIENFPKIIEKSNFIKDMKEKLSINVYSLLKRRQESNFQDQSSTIIYKDNMIIQNNEQEMSLTQFIDIV